MPQLSASDCEAILQALDERPFSSPIAVEAATRLRQRFEQATEGKAVEGLSLTESESPQVQDLDSQRSYTLHVCTSCRLAETPRVPRENRQGNMLYEELCGAIAGSPVAHRVDVRPAECLSLCPRPCGIALSSPGAWTYLFGDQRPGESAAEIVDCVTRYIEAEDGFLPRGKRPESLRASILGRVPPSPETKETG